MVVGCLPFDVDLKKPVNNQHRRELFVEETRRGIKTRKHQEHLGKTSYCESSFDFMINHSQRLIDANALPPYSTGFKELASRMLCPDERKRIKMRDVEKHNWLGVKYS